MLNCKDFVDLIMHIIKDLEKSLDASDKAEEPVK